MKRLTLLIVIFLCVKAYSQKPNVVIFIADDVSWNDFGSYGNEEVKTPNIDQIAKEGVQFSNVFLTASSCSPSRISILTGRYPHNTGAPELHMPSLPNMPNLAGSLKEAGYYTVSAGKWHQGAEMRPSFDKIYDKKNGNGGEDNWVNSLESRDKTKPFFMWFASFDAHRSWGENEFSGSNSSENIKVPPYMIDSDPTKVDLAKYYDEITRFDAFVAKVKDKLASDKLLENTVIIIMADNGRPFPRCKTRLYDDGIKTPFIVSWQGTLPKKQKSESIISAIDIAPTILDLCEVRIPESMQGRSFKKVFKQPKELFRTYAFAEHNWHDYEAYERMVRTKDYLYIYNGRAHFQQSTSADNHRDSSFQELVKKWKDGKLTSLQKDNFIAPRNMEELYDLQKDPNQFNDISQNPQYAEKLKELRAVRKEWQEQTGDSEPQKLSPSNFDWLMGYKIDNGDCPFVRGETAGASNKAHLINHSGKF